MHDPPAAPDGAAIGGPVVKTVEQRKMAPRGFFILSDCYIIYFLK